MWEARCLNPTCKDALAGKRIICVSCRTVGAFGMLVGGLVVGILHAIF